MIFRILCSGHPKRAWRQFRSLRKLRHPSHPLKLHVGCGQRHFDGFVNIDINHSLETDYVCDIGEIPCRENTVIRIEGYHVIEHIQYPRVKNVLREWYRILRSGGKLVIECPDADQAMQEYLDGNEEMLFSIYGRQRFNGDAHYWGYNFERLKNLLESIGFENIIEAKARDEHAKHEPCMRVECEKTI